LIKGFSVAGFCGLVASSNERQMAFGGQVMSWAFASDNRPDHFFLQ
jgi:hypothetical protein